MNNLKVGVIGVGNLGMHHARIYSEMEGVELVGISDIDKKKVETLSKKYNTQAFHKPFDLIDKVDAVSIVVPTPLHYEIAKTYIENKIHCLVEKPITVSVEEADSLIELAHKHNVTLQVGHIERFNPAVIEAQKHIHAPKFIEINRLGPYSPRVSHIGVVLDLMVHDLDMVLFLTQSEVESIDAVGTKVLSKFEDIANVRLRFKNGCVANISASRISLKKVRKIRIFQDDSYISLNYEKQNLNVYKKKKENIESLKDIKIIKPRVKKNEPLLMELEDFKRCIKEETKPLVEGIHGKNALELALYITKLIKN